MTRMERYKNNADEEETVGSRVSRNSELYQDIKSSELSNIRKDNNVQVIESNGKTIDLEKIRKYIEQNSIEHKQTRRSVSINDEVKENKEIVENEEKPKDYDLNSVLEKAKKSREIDYDSERYKKLRDTQYDILSKLKMYEETDEETVPSKEEFNTDERTLINLINTVTIHKGELGLLDDLLVGEGGEKTEPIEKEKEKKEYIEEIEKNVVNTESQELPTLENLSKEQQNEQSDNSKINITKVEIPGNDSDNDKTQELVNLKEKAQEIDNSFYTNSMTFNKKDFEGFDELEKSVKKNSVFGVIMTIIFVIFIIVTLVIMANYVFDLGLF